jgi:hypothetical protein
MPRFLHSCFDHEENYINQTIYQLSCFCCKLVQKSGFPRRKKPSLLTLPGTMIDRTTGTTSCGVYKMDVIRIPATIRLSGLPMLQVKAGGVALTTNL